MKKHLRNLFITVMTLCLTLCISSCGTDPTSTHTDSYNDYNDDKYSDIIALANYTKDKYDAGQLEVGTVIRSNFPKDYEAYPDIAEIFSSNSRFYKVTMRDENTVIVQTNVIFQSAHGYLVTSEKSLDTYLPDGSRYPKLDIPDVMHYDGSFISIEKYIGELDGLNLYYYSAGL